jgi:hypothetical protein
VSDKEEDKDKDKDKMMNRAIGLFESIARFPDKTKKGIQKIAYGRWIVSSISKTVKIINETDDFGQWIFGKRNITHTTPEGHNIYLPKSK